MSKLRTGARFDYLRTYCNRGDSKFVAKREPQFKFGSRVPSKFELRTCSEPESIQ
jgi:hypothetical protein